MHLQPFLVDKSAGSGYSSRRKRSLNDMQQVLCMYCIVHTVCTYMYAYTYIQYFAPFCTIQYTTTCRYARHAMYNPQSLRPHQGEETSLTNKAYWSIRFIPARQDLRPSVNPGNLLPKVHQQTAIHPRHVLQLHTSSPYSLV